MPKKTCGISFYLLLIVQALYFTQCSSFFILPSTLKTSPNNNIQSLTGKSLDVIKAKNDWISMYSYPNSKEEDSTEINESGPIITEGVSKFFRRSVICGFLCSFFVLDGIYEYTPDHGFNYHPDSAVNAISGGGKDYAEQDLKGAIFAKQKLNEKDFSGAQCQNCDFSGAQLRGARFYKSNLKGANFEGADLTGASMEGSALDETSFRNSILEGAYFSSSSLVKTVDIQGADFTEALLRDDMSKKLCEGNSVRQKASGENPSTGVATRDSLFCD